MTAGAAKARATNHVAHREKVPHLAGCVSPYEKRRLLTFHRAYILYITTNLPLRSVILSPVSQLVRTLLCSALRFSFCPYQSRPTNLEASGNRSLPVGVVSLTRRIFLPAHLPSSWTRCRCLRHRVRAVLLRSYRPFHQRLPVGVAARDTTCE